MGELVGERRNVADACRQGAARSPISQPTYAMYGIRVQSDILLPFLPSECEQHAPPDIIVCRAPLDAGQLVPGGPLIAFVRSPEGDDEMVTRVYRGAGGTWIWNRSVGTCHLTPDARRVTVYIEHDTDENLLRQILVSQVLVIALHGLGCPSLHASSVLLGRLGALTFVGTSGDGKSTMAAAFLRHGAELLTDDALPLRLREDGVYGGPGVPAMKLWPETARCALNLTEELPHLATLHDKRLLTLDGRYRFASSPAFLRAVYLLRRYDPEAAGRTDTVIRPLHGRQAVTALLAQTSHRATIAPSRMAGLLPLYARLVGQAAVCVLEYPHGFEYQESVRERILTELEGMA